MIIFTVSTLIPAVQYSVAVLSTTVKQCRPIGLIYNLDPLHTLPSQRDHARETYKAHTKADRVVRFNKILFYILNSSKTYFISEKGSSFSNNVFGPPALSTHQCETGRN